MDLSQLQQWTWLLLLVGIWTLPWKGVALWKAAKNNDKTWFIILLMTNTLAILEIVYIFIFSKKKEKENDDIIHTTLDF